MFMKFIHSFIQPIIQSIIHSFIYPYIHSFIQIHSFNSFIHSIHSFHSFNSFIQIHSFNSFIQFNLFIQFIQFIYSFIHIKTSEFSLRILPLLRNYDLNYAPPPVSVMCFKVCMNVVLSEFSQRNAWSGLNFLICIFICRTIISMFS